MVVVQYKNGRRPAFGVLMLAFKAWCRVDALESISFYSCASDSLDIHHCTRRPPF